MTWRLLAYSIAALHIAYVLFVVLGGLLVLYQPGLVWLHLAAVTWAGATMILNFGCPLTPSEKALLRRGGGEPYEEGFVQHYVFRTKFRPENERRNHALIGIAVIVLNLAIYMVVLL